MKGKISKIKNTKGELALPVTTTEAVYMEDGITKLSDEIKDVLKYEILDDENITAEIPNVIEEIDGIKKNISEINSSLDNVESLKATKQEVDIERKRIDTFTKLSEGSTTGDAELIDARIGIDGFIYNNIGNAIREQIKDNVVLNNPYNILSNEYNVGFVDLTGSFYKTDANYMYTDYIKVYGDKIYWKNFISHKLIRFISCFDINKNPLLGTGVNASTSGLQISGEYELPTNCCYVIVTMFSENKNEVYKSVVGFEPIVDYEKPNTRYINSKFIKTENRTVEINRLNGKSVYSFGDSLLYGHYSGEGFLDGLANECNMNYTKCAINGAEVIQNIINQIYNAPNTEPDFVVLDGMTNDATKDITTTLGELTALDVFESPSNHDTFYGSLEHIFYTLRNKYPNAKIIYVIPHLMPTRPIARQKTLADAVIKTCKKWAIPIVNIQEEGQINTCIENMRIKYSYDNQGETSGGNGTHLTGVGYDKWYKPLVKAKMLELI